MKLCDFDLCSDMNHRSGSSSSRTSNNNSSSSNRRVTTPKLQTPVGSLEFMAPEVTNIVYPGKRLQFSEKD